MESSQTLGATTENEVTGLAFCSGNPGEEPPQRGWRGPLRTSLVRIVVRGNPQVRVVQTHGPW